MADTDHPNGRMLFTDFDASDKGRPVAVFEENAAQTAHELPHSAVRNLDALAASLELDFEDDGDGAPPPPPLFPPPEKQQPEEAAADTTAAPASAAPAPAPEPAPQRDDDPELALEEVDNLKGKTGIHAAPPVTEAPSWDALASAYEQALPIGREALSGGGGDGRDPFAAFAAFAQAARGDDGIDVLSMLDEYLERENRPPAPLPDSPAAEDAFPEPRPVPYGGVERVSDWFAPPEDQPEPFPRIEDWFSPPEDQAEQPLRVEDWYEPPEPGAAERNDRDEPGVDISWLSDFRNELPADEYWRKKTTRITKVADSAAALIADADIPADAPPSDPAVKVVKPRHPAADTAELFADMDFNTLWERNVAAKQQPQPAPDSETRRMRLFDDIDIDSLWDKKQDAAGNSAPRTNAPALGAAGGTTVIVPQGALNAAGTVILRNGLEGLGAGQPSPGSAPATDAAAQPRTPDEKRTTTIAERSVLAASAASAAAASSGAPGAAEAGGAGFDGRLIDGDRRGGDAGDGEEEYVARTPADDLLDGIDIDSHPDGADSVSAPVIDDSAIDEIPVRTRSYTDEMRAVAEGEPAAEGEPVAVNPMDVFADMDNMDFSDDVDDEMRALLEDEEGEGAEEDAATADAQADAAEEAAEIIPATRLGRVLHSASKLSRRVLPMRFIDKAMGMIAWRENWWFYCDLVAAVVASASLAVIISYFFWYRGV